MNSEVNPSPAAASPTEPQPAPPPGSASPSGIHAGPSSFLVYGLVSGLVALAAIEVVGRPFRTPPEIVAQAGSPPSGDGLVLLNTWERRNHFRNTAVSFALFGWALGAGLGLAEARARRPARGLLACSLPAGFLGAVFAGLGGFEAVAVEERLSNWAQADDLHATYAAIMMHAAAWCLTAVGIVLGLGLAVRRASYVAYGLLAVTGAALLAALMYSPLSAVLSIVFPSRLSAELPIPEGLRNRIFWAALPAVLMGLAVGRIPRK